MVAIEDLNTDGMGRSAKGTRESPGRNVRVKSGLNRALKDVAFGEFRRQLAYKAAGYGRTLVAVDWFFALSKRRSGCGAEHDALGLAEWRWRCAACGARHGRHVNAAQIIEAEGRRRMQHPEEAEGVCACGGEREGFEQAERGAVSARIGRAA